MGVCRYLLERQDPGARLSGPIERHYRTSGKVHFATRNGLEQRRASELGHQRLPAQENDARTRTAGMGEDLGKIEVVSEHDVLMLPRIIADFPILRFAGT